MSSIPTTLRGTDKQIQKCIYIIPTLLKRWEIEDHPLYSKLKDELQQQHEASFWLDNRFKPLESIAGLLNKPIATPIAPPVAKPIEQPEVLKPCFISSCSDRQGNYPNCTDKKCSGRKDYQSHYEDF